MENGSLPTVLYHYTDAQGLKGILDKQTLWATNIYYLNDSQEYDYARVAANGIIWQRAQAALDQREKEVLLFLCQPGGIALEPEKLRLIPEVFVASFSEDGDSLSQWRGYCPNGGGYSLGFVAEKLRDEGRVQGFGLARCLYDDEDQRKAIEPVLDGFMKSASWIRAIEHPGEDDSRGAVIEAWRDRFLLLAPTIKHCGFKEEKEWRLISSPIPLEDPRCLVRVGRSMLIPYVEIDLVAINPSIPVKEVKVGPTPHMWLAMRAAGSLLDSRCPTKSFGGDPAISNSKIPYRYW